MSHIAVDIQVWRTNTTWIDVHAGKSTRDFWRYVLTCDRIMDIIECKGSHNYFKLTCPDRMTHRQNDVCEHQKHCKGKKNTRDRNVTDRTDWDMSVRPKKLTQVAFSTDLWSSMISLARRTLFLHPLQRYKDLFHHCCSRHIENEFVCLIQLWGLPSRCYVGRIRATSRLQLCFVLGW